MTRLPASAISVAATRPASPPPTTMTSASSAIGCLPLVERLKPAALTTVNGKYRHRRVNRSHRSVRPSDRDRQVHPARNTRFEFGPDRPGDLDKSPISQHAAGGLAS